MKSIKPVACLFLFLAVCACGNKTKQLNSTEETKKVVLNDTLTVNAKLLLSEDFSEGLENWKVEQAPGGEVFASNGKLEISDSMGCTVWYVKILEGPIMIEYDAVVLKNGGPFDRASDLNCFWMANDPANPDKLFVNSDFQFL